MYPWQSQGTKSISNLRGLLLLLFFNNKPDCSRPNPRESPAAQHQLLQRPPGGMAGPVPRTSIFWQGTFGKTEPRSFLKIAVATVKIARAFTCLKKRTARVTTRQSQLFIKSANGGLELWIISREISCQKHSVHFETCSSTYI